MSHQTIVEHASDKSFKKKTLNSKGIAVLFFSLLSLILSIVAVMMVTQEEKRQRDFLVQVCKSYLLAKVNGEFYYSKATEELCSNIE